MRKFEASLGADLSSVRVHTGTDAAPAAEAVGTRAYATGNDVHFAHGESSSTSATQAKLNMSAPSDADHAASDAQTIAAGGVSGASGLLPHIHTIQRLFGGHDIRGVKASVGGSAAVAAKQLGAQAYTTGNSIAFRDEPDLHTAAHEAAHVVQQRAGVQLSGGMGDVGDVYERHADAVADRVVRGEPAQELLGEIRAGSTTAAAGVQRKAWIGAQPLTVDEGYRKIVRTTWGDKAVKRLEELTRDALEHHFANWGDLAAEYERAQAAPAAPSAPEDPNAAVQDLPGFGQRGGSCAAASLITPLLVWDKETYDPAKSPNSRLRSLVQKMKMRLIEKKQTLQPRFEARKPGAYQSSIELLKSVDDLAKEDSFKIAEHDYQALGVLLMNLAQDTPSSGLNEAETQTARSIAGFSGATKPVRMFDSFFDSTSDLQHLQAGQMAQIVWFMKPDQVSTDPLAPPPKLDTHAFTVGRLTNGKWILNDQGYRKPLVLTGDDLALLKDAIVKASESGRWAGVTDDKYHEPDDGVVTGYAILGDPSTMDP